MMTQAGSSEVKGDRQERNEGNGLDVELPKRARIALPIVLESGEIRGFAGYLCKVRKTDLLQYDLGRFVRAQVRAHEPVQVVQGSTSALCVLLGKKCEP
jgi:hypothetical protein